MLHTRDRGRDAGYPAPTGSPEAVARPRFPQNVACRFPALRSSEDDSQHCESLWFERVVKGRLRGKAQLVRYIDDFVICFQYRSDAIRVQDALRLRLGKFGLTLEPTKTKLSPASSS